VPPSVVKARDDRLGMFTQAKRELREGYLPAYETVPGADTWEQTGEGITFEPLKAQYKK
jgi:hypothetical protein